MYESYMLGVTLYKQLSIGITPIVSKYQGVTIS